MNRELRDGELYEVYVKTDLYWKAQHPKKLLEILSRLEKAYNDKPNKLMLIEARKREVRAYMRKLKKEHPLIWGDLK